MGKNQAGGNTSNNSNRTGAGHQAGKQQENQQQQNPGPSNMFDDLNEHTDTLRGNRSSSQILEMAEFFDMMIPRIINVAEDQKNRDAFVVSCREFTALYLKEGVEMELAVRKGVETASELHSRIRKHRAGRGNFVLAG